MKCLGMGVNTGSVFAMNSGKKDRDRSDSLLAILEERAYISRILLTHDKDNKKSIFLVIFLNIATLRGSNGGAIREVKTLLRSHLGGNTVLFFSSNIKDLIRSFNMLDVEIFGNFCRNTYVNIDLYPWIDDTVNFLFLLGPIKCQLF